MKNKYAQGLVALIFLFTTGCAFKVAEDEPQAKENPNDILLLATLYQQKAAEKDALSYQAFNMARNVLNDDSKRMGLSKQAAVVVDIDETVLDNSPYEAEMILEHIQYPEKWKEWIEAADAKALPGSVEFLKYAEERGYEVFYITNRREQYKQATLENLSNHGFPFADEEHLLMRKEESSKKSRREKVMETHRIALLMGDNLADFSEVFDNVSLERRAHLVDSLKQKWGFRYIVLPNAMYGDWLESFYDYKHNLSPQEKKEVLINSLQGF